MNSIRLGVYDIFSFIIPGIVYIILISFSLNLVTPEQFMNTIFSLSVYSLLGCFFLAYLVGFAFENLATKYCNSIIRIIKGKLKSRLIEEFNENHPDAKIKDYIFSFIYAFADIYSPASREKADNFSALSKMSRNLSLGFLLFIPLTLIYSFLHFNQISWLLSIFKIVAAILISLIFLFHADRYDANSHRHLLNTYYIVSKDRKKSILRTRRKRSNAE